MPLSSDELQLLEIVAADLEFLREEWNNEVDDHSLRRSSTVLRRLLVENDLHRAWKLAGFEGQATVTSSTLDEILKAVSAHRVKYATAGGASFKGAELRGALMLDFALPPGQADRLSQGPPPDKEYPLLEFIEDPCTIVGGKLIRRRHVIKYVSNKLGGAHLDHRRGRRKDDEIYERLDKLSKELMLLEKPAVYFELLSIGQAVANSQDLHTLTDKISQLLDDASA